jgi:glutamate dehydrogenase (NADP+)
MNLKNVRRGRIKEYVEKYPAVYTPVDPDGTTTRCGTTRPTAPFPVATQNEINAKDAQNLVNNGVIVVSEGANMPTTPRASTSSSDNKLLYGPGKAANAGGVCRSRAWR